MATSNRLGGETSPYLLQHARNPVHWMPWGDEALALAREQDRPILLSVGYSACHWCHVMAHESFEDEPTATLMNALFVNVKVDREERPDLDRIYQSAHQLLIRRAGGWPLTMFLTPDGHVPFFGGTYFPPQARYGMPSFKEVLTRVAAYFREHRDDIRGQRDDILRALASIEPEGGAGATLDATPLAQARNQLEAAYDSHHGGFGDAPKFPHPSNLERLLRHHAASVIDAHADETALTMSLHSLAAMIDGGIFDQLGGGFYRYSVDTQWMIPHFEKMLYDNGPLLQLCAWSWQLTGEASFAHAARATAAWVMREMQSPQGGYRSSLDADSEGEEGRYYVWQPQQVRSVLEAREYAVLAARFGLDRAPNFEDRAWHLHGFESLQHAARAAGVSEQHAAELLTSARNKLLAARERRVRPGLDDKILASWNGLMIKGMSVAGRVLGEPRYVASAERALDFVRAHMMRDRQLLASWRSGHAHLNAYLDDHALLIDGVLALLECRWRDGDLDFARNLADALLERFHDAQLGGFFFTSHDHEQLIARPKPMTDDALPSGNGVAARVLGRLGHLLGEARYLEAAASTLRTAWTSIERYPHAHNALLGALEEHLRPPVCVVLRGDGPELERWRARAGARYAPARSVLAIPTQAVGLSGLLAAREPRGGTLAYVCRGLQCETPITDFACFEAVLRATEVAGSM